MILFGPLALAVGAGYFYVTSGRYISTENAYVKADKIAISADVTGRVVEVAVDDNEVVDKGQLLFRVDDEPFRIALARAQAELGIVRNEIESFRTAYRQERAELKMAEENLGYYQREFQRQQKLSKRGLVSQSTHDEARQRLREARQRITAIEEDITHALVNLAGNPELSPDDHPRYERAVAERDRAALDLARTEIRAPAAGIMSTVGLEVGEYVEEGDAVFSLITSAALWVTANLKETQLTYVEVGQRAVIRADAYPDREWQAVVESISPATGAEFSLLPPQNASGNWVKVVQRVPVRLALSGPLGDRPLQVGLSVGVDIDTERTRVLPSLVQSALAWINNPRHGETSKP